MTYLHMKTTTPKPPAVSKLDLAAAIYRKIRSEKEPPLARYAMILAIARRNGRPATGQQIGKDIGMDTAPNGTIDAALRHGLIAHGPPAPARGTTTYVLTPAGIALAHELITPPVTTLAP